MTEQEKRRAIVEEAKTWLGTPYVPEARVKGAGTDCGMFILQTFENVGLIEHIEIPHYPVDIACHCSDPMYLNWIEKYSKKVNREPLPGDVIVYKFPGSKVPHHAAICIDSEYIIHSHVRSGVVLSNRRGYKKYEVGVYSFWG